SYSSHTERICWGVHKSFGIRVISLRVHHQFRWLSRDGKSVLNVTEVEDLDMIPCLRLPGSEPPRRNEWLLYAGSPWPTSKVKEMEQMGSRNRWYEAYITSTYAEGVFAQNGSLRFGQVTTWTTDELKQNGVWEALYRPALRMLGHLDKIGR